MTKLNNPPAFPHPSLWGAAADGTKYKVTGMMDGMSLRDFFAAHAPLPPKEAFDQAYDSVQNSPNVLKLMCEYVAAWKYSVADAMLLEREKKTTGDMHGV